MGRLNLWHEAGKSALLMPEASDDDGGWPDLELPNGQKVKDVIQQHRTILKDRVDQIQANPESLDGGLGYAAGHYLAMARPHGEIDFKNKFKGQADPTDLARAGNFAYYAIGSGILPDSVLDVGASGYNLYKHISKQSFDGTGPFEPDASAHAVRDAALAYGAGLK